MSRRPSQKGPPIVEIERKEVERLLKVCEELLPQDLFELVKGLWNTLEELTKLVQERGTTIARLRRLFGLTSSEKLADVLGETEPPNPTPGAAAQPSETETGAAAEEMSTGVLAGSGEDGAESKPLDDTEQERKKKKKKVKGHSRVPASAYLAATHIAKLC